MNKVQQPALAGTWYPAGPDELRRTVEDYIRNADVHGPVPKAIVAPHAGYMYSGPVAGSAYARVAPARDIITKVVLAGPSHRTPFNGIAIPSFDAFATPLGELAIDKASLHVIQKLPQVQVLDSAFTSEDNSLEVQFPFLQVALDDFTLVPLSVGSAEAEQVAEVLEAVWGGEETLIVVSSDLTHFMDYETAKKLDSATSRAIEELRPDEISYEQACGRIPLTGLLQAARTHGMQAETVDLRNSHDTAGTGSHIVGYGAYVFV